MKDKTPKLLSYAFRPFFLLNGFFAILVVLAWMMALHGVGLPAMTPLWHAHEMLVGFAMAAVAGFSLTAVAVWTGRPALCGAPLAWLMFCWLAGRLTMALSVWLQPGLVFLLDMLFPTLLCVLLAREIIGGGNRRNYPLIVVTAVMAAVNGVYHLGINQVVPNGDRLAMFLLIHTMLLLVTIIAGRIVPSFTGNWLRRQGRKRLPLSSTVVELSVILLTVLIALAVGFMPTHPVTGVLAFAAALAHGLSGGALRLLQTRCCSFFMPLMHGCRLDMP